VHFHCLFEHDIRYFNTVFVNWVNLFEYSHFGKQMGRKNVSICQKIQIVALLKPGISFENIRNQLDVSNGCISNVSEKVNLGLPLEKQLVRELSIDSI